MILENGVVRTMDPSLPDRAGARDRGRRTSPAASACTRRRSRARTSSTSAAAASSPPSPTRTSTSPPGRSRSDRCARRLRVVRRGARAGARGRDRAGSLAARLRLARRRLEPDVEPTEGALDEVTGETPAILISKDYHSAWLNSAALAAADGDLDVDGGVVERDEHGRADRHPPRGVGLAVPRPLRPHAPRTSGSRRRGRGIKLANSRGVGAIHDKDGWLGAPGIFQRLRDEGNLSLRVWGSIPHEQLDARAALSLRSGFGDEFLRIGYLKCFMDGTLGSQTALLTDGSGVEITSRARSSRRSSGAAPSAAGRSACTRSATRRTGTRSTRSRRRATRGSRKGLRQRIEHAQCLAPEDLPRFAELGVACSVQFSHAPSDRDLAERLWADRLDGTYAFRSLLDSGALVANGSDAPVEELDPLAGIAAGVLRTIDERPAWRAGGGADGRAGAPRRRASRPPGSPATSAAAASCCPAISPTSSCSTATRSTSSRRSCATLQVVATMVGGRWVHNPPALGRSDRGADGASLTDAPSSHPRPRDLGLRPDLEPVLEVEPGAVVRFETNDCFTGQIQSEDDLVTDIDFSRVNSATGPVAVRGAEPGDSLVVELLEVTSRPDGLRDDHPGVRPADRAGRARR